MVTGICYPNRSQAQHQYNTISLKKLHLTKLTSLSIIRNILQQHSWKPFSLYKFSRKPVSGWCQIKHLHCTIFMHPKPPHFESTWKANAYIFLQISTRKFLLQRHRKFFFGWWGLNDFLKAACCFYLIKCFKFFNQNFWKFNYFPAFQYFHQ